MKTKKQLTAIEWLQMNMATSSAEEMVENINVWFEQAKEMEKEQIRKSYCDGELHFVSKQIRTSEQYYNETFKSE
jgi:hypothetical protein